VEKREENSPPKEAQSGVNRVTAYRAVEKGYEEDLIVV